MYGRREGGCVDVKWVDHSHRMCQVLSAALNFVRTYFVQQNTITWRT